MDLGYYIPFRAGEPTTISSMLRAKDVRPLKTFVIKSWRNLVKKFPPPGPHKTLNCNDIRINMSHTVYGGAASSQPHRMICDLHSIPEINLARSFAYNYCTGNDKFTIIYHIFQSRMGSQEINPLWLRNFGHESTVCRRRQQDDGGYKISFEPTNDFYPREDDEPG